MNEVHEVLRAHRSIRDFEERAIPDELVREAVVSAQHASTSSNVQAYSILRVRDAQRREELATMCGDQAMVRDAAAFFVVCGDLRRHEVIAREAGSKCEHNLETFLLAAIDAALFAQNLAIAFESSGLGICFVGGLRNRLQEVDVLLALPHGVLPFFGMCVGYPKETPAKRPRLPVDAVLFEEAYPEDEVLVRHIAGYDRAIEPWYAARGLAGRDWSGAIARRFAKRLRPELRDYYRSKGVSLD